MHILLIHQAFAALDEPGGTRHHEMARYLVAKGHQVTVIASPVSYLTGRSGAARSPGSSQPTTENLTILRAYTYPALHRSFFHRVLSFLSFMVSSGWIGLKIQDVDLVWGTSPPIFQSLTAWLISRLKRTPFLLEIRDLWPSFAVAVGVLKNRVLIRLSEGLEAFLYRHADLVMVNSPGFTGHVKAHGASMVAVVPNGADPRMFDPQEDGRPFRIKHGLQDKYVVLYAGAHGLSNDLSVVLKAAEILKHREDILFVLLGDGKEKPALIAQSRQMALKNVKFLDPIPKVEMPAAIAAADACVAILKPVPLYATVYPNKVFDYMAAGKPVILAIEGVIRKVIEDTGSGIPVTPGSAGVLSQAVIQLANNRQQGEQMGKRGRAYIEANFDRAVLADQLESLLQNLVNSGK
jgi:glycosyltransferase involved in cell wall biosynthesis